MTRFLIEGMVHAALLYTPQLRPGLLVEHALDDELIMVASFPDATPDMNKEYVSIDWGPEFIHAQTAALPNLNNTGVTMALGALAGEYIANRRAIGYLPARAAKRRLDAGTLYVVTDAPRFPYPSWVVWRDDIDEDLAKVARAALLAVVQNAENEQEYIVEDLEVMDASEPAQHPRITNS
jgi:DNA-binding transcriptional LysR family regulator